MSHMRKIIIPAAVATTLLVLLLGNQFWPWVYSVRDSSREKILALADQHQLKLNQANQALEQFKTQIMRFEADRVRVNGLLADLESREELIRSRIFSREMELTRFQEKLVQSEPIFTSTGRSIDNAELHSTIDQHRRLLESDRQQLKSLQQMVEIGARRRTYLDRACEAAPVQLRNLKSEIGLLEEKLALVEDMKSWQAELRDNASAGSADEFVAELRQIGRDVDAEIAGLDALLRLELEDDQTLTPAPSTDSLIASIEKALGPVQGQ